MKKYYFTFGTAEWFPYQGGWVEVTAEDVERAVALFNTMFPPKSEIVNCSFVYPEEKFRKTDMYQDGNYGARCHASIVFSEQNENALPDGHPSKA